jgi:hypothetical protein
MGEGAAKKPPLQPEKSTQTASKKMLPVDDCVLRGKACFFGSCPRT